MQIYNHPPKIANKLLKQPPKIAIIMLKQPFILAYIIIFYLFKEKKLTKF